MILAFILAFSIGMALSTEHCYQFSNSNQNVGCQKEFFELLNSFHSFKVENPGKK